ncbi:MAG: bifunctional diaminohydroxyphosphoribosylaminopyrimidine deaminase/5-amino-6-(5-phosphoribosylamino)uracil reductase RibD [Pseudomonadota bacterium]
MRDDREAILEAISLAERATGDTAPNPRVGCILVKDGAVVGQGWHARPGGDHAEVAALKDAGENARGATAYVTLEPCNHTGRTGPCSVALIEAGVGEVVYAVADPNDIAAGGAAAINAAGVPCRKATGGVAEAEHLTRAWRYSVSKKRPYVVAKAAMTLDGRIATRNGDSKWITGPEARARAHELRREADAILVGAETVITDYPTLTARIDGREWGPLRVVLDPQGRTPPGAKVFDRSGRGALLVVSETLPESATRAHQRLGVDILRAPYHAATGLDLDVVLEALHARNILMLMVEGGGRALGAFADADRINEIWLFYAPRLLGGGASAFNGEGPALINDAARFELEAPEPLGNDFLIRGVRKGSA